MITKCEEEYRDEGIQTDIAMNVHVMFCFVWCSD